MTDKPKGKVFLVKDFHICHPRLLEQQSGEKLLKCFQSINKNTLYAQQPYVALGTRKNYHKKPFPQQCMWKNAKYQFLPVRIKDVYIF